MLKNLDELGEVDNRGKYVIHSHIREVYYLDQWYDDIKEYLSNGDFEAVNYLSVIVKSIVKKIDKRNIMYKGWISTAEYHLYAEHLFSFAFEMEKAIHFTGMYTVTNFKVYPISNDFLLLLKSLNNSLPGILKQFKQSNKSHKINKIFTKKMKNNEEKYKKELKPLLDLFRKVINPTKKELTDFFYSVELSNSTYCYDLHKIAKDFDLSDSLLGKFLDFINSPIIIRKFKLSETFIRKHLDEFEIGDILTFQKDNISPEFRFTLENL